MLVPYMYVFVLIGLVILLAIIFSVLGNKKPEKRTLYKGLSWLCGIAGVVGGLGILLAGSKVMIFTGKAPAIEYEKLFLLGSKTLTIDGTEYPIASSERGNWIVNASASPLGIHTAEYSSFSFGGSGPSDRLVPPKTTATTPRIDNIGPDDPLPSSVSSKSSSETRVQVTW